MVEDLVKCESAMGWYKNLFDEVSCHRMLVVGESVIEFPDFFSNAVLVEGVC